VARISRRVPGPFVALIAATARPRSSSACRNDWRRFGSLNASFPHPRSRIVRRGDHIARGTGVHIAMPVNRIALVGGGCRRNDRRPTSAQLELVAQGVANLVSPMFGGIPATGAIAHPTNIKNGGRAGGWDDTRAHPLGGDAVRRPMGGAHSSGRARSSSWSHTMSEWRTFLAELRSPKSDVAVLLTIRLTVLVDLTVAISVGMVLAAFLFIRRMAEVTNVTAVGASWRKRATTPSRV
jgi:SulP family sulfate permease